ncbi:NirA family protein [Bradyrhizobium diazoefficiens]|nr:NirA family protein [Bradyrhizobium diazoefficiens]MBR0965429.1 NirA family protein [Bradyrhizobium diazoefficiens]MBR0979964.1 NirA family protein [Bradyrhizobium diazoefficiens]MBR1009312.1 NirA family protein [Bradyrhizobium diazoefficiens]MBR1015617.1 NirA family protein [Bradyrhizobium diazoefficiens]MBR1053289.1 NirA family protein [Bradyrhizobium diazoefficiens]
MKIDPLSIDFTDEQKRYLEGFTTGLQISRVGRGLGGGAGKATAEPTGPDAVHIKAQDKVIASGRKLADQERFKRDEHPFDAYPRLRQQAADNAPPSPADNFRWRYYGIFYVAPTQDSYMCRLRIPNGIMKHWQLSGLADLADDLCGPYSHATTRANLQLREIPPKHAIRLIEGIQDLGLCSRGSGADNIRNVTGTPTAGIDPQELIDTRPYAREWHYHILNDRSLYGLPRKFNVAFDGAGKVAVLEETNDIAFTAVEVKDGFGVEPGIWFRLGLGGITGHKDFARYSGIIVKPEQATAVADAIIRVFIDHGDRTNRNKARLKYVLDAMGHNGFLKFVEERLKTPFTRVPEEAFLPRPASDRMAHVGVHKQKQAGLNWIGVSLALGKMSCDQMRGLAKVARDLGDGEIRLTVWQNLLISGVRDENVELAIAAIKAMGLAVEASHIRAGLIACTGSAGCRFGASDTKRSAAEIGDWCEPRVAMDKPVNIHVTGCHHSCAQHYISDIGLIGARVPVNDEDTVDGYHLFTGGGFGPDADVGQEVYHDLKAEDAPKTVEGLLKAYIAHRASPDETFLSFARRHDGETLRRLADAQVSA